MNTPSRRLASVTSMPSNDPSSTTVSITSAEARMMSPRPNLIPGTSPRSSTGSAASVWTSSASISRVITNPWTPMSGWPTMRWAAAARLRTAPPIPTIRSPAAGERGQSG